MSLYTFIMAFVILTFLMSITYFYMFVKSKERFIQFWALSWLAYSGSLFLLILSYSFDSTLPLELRNLLDILNILLLLFGAYSFMHIRIPSYWIRFTLYLFIWVLIGTYYSFDTLSVYLPVFTYQIIATFALCHIVFRFWNVSILEKGLSIAIFMIWGLGKTAISFYESYFYDIPALYSLEIVFSNVLNFCIFVIYLYRSKDSMVLAERVYRIIAENAEDVIFYYELVPHPSFRHITPSIEKITGYAPEDFYSNPKLYLELVVLEEIDAFSALFSGTREGEEQKVFRIQNKEGELIWIEINDSVLYENGVAVAVQGIMRDITKIKEDEESLLSTKQSRDLLFSYISHELKTPVTAIVGYTTGLKDGTFKSEEETNAALDVIFTKSLMLQRLLADLVQLSKLEAKKISFKMTQISALELCENLTSTHALDIQAAGFELETAIDTTLLAKVDVIVDTERIKQVTSNIIFNALKYSEKNGKIAIKCFLDGDFKNLVVQIADDGPGILPEDLPYIFERGYRGHSHVLKNEDFGSGMGLTLSKEIILAFDGDIWAQNARGGGSMFTFTLPVYEDVTGYEG